MSQLTLKQLTAQLLRKHATADQPNPRTAKGETPDYVRRFLKKGQSDGTAAVASSAGSVLGDVADFTRSLSRARMALLSEKPSEGEHQTLAEMMGN